MQRTNIRLEQLVRKRTAELRSANTLLQAEIIERKRIERDIVDLTQQEQQRFGSQLHDGVCQEIAGLVLFTKSLTQTMQKAHLHHVEELQKISGLLQAAATAARDTARGLYPGELNGDSLMHNLEELAIRTQYLHSITCKFHCTTPVHITNNNIATHLYRIAQEGITNALAHGKATVIHLRLTQHNDRVTLALRDNGSGLSAQAVAAPGIGLRIMQYRARIMGAVLTITANRPHGVVLRCVVHLPAGSPS